MEKPNTSNQNKSVGIIMALVLVFALASAVALVYLQLASRGQESTNTSTPLVLGGETLPANNIRVPFEYTIVSINDDLITLAGEHGNMELPVDNRQVTVYHVGDNTKANLTDLIVGQTVNLAIVPGEKAWVGIE